MSCIAQSTVSSPCSPQRRDELERLLLAADVERGRRLVEQEQRRLLRERAAEHGPLLLAAAQRLEPPVGERAEVEAGERAARDLEVARAFAAERPEVRRAPEQDVFVDAHPRGQERGLGNEGEPPCHLPARERRDLVAVERDRAVVAQEPGARAEERALPGAVRADQRDPLAGRDLRADAVEHPGRPELDRERVEDDRGHRNVLLERSTTAKNGAPKKAVTTPIGSSAGETIVRAITSQSTRNPPPRSSESGSTIR